MAKLFKNKAILSLLEAYMPKAGAEARGEAIAQAQSLAQAIIISKPFIQKLKKAEAQKNLNDYELGVIRVLKRTLKYYKALPKNFLEEFTRTTTQANSVWAEAKEKNDFSMFEPYLDRLVKLSRKKAKYLGYKEHPYDALLDEYEEGLTTEQVESYFAQLKAPLKEILAKIKKSNKYSESSRLEFQTYKKENVKKTNDKILNLLKADGSKLRSDLSSHPFSQNLGLGDGRITTRHKGFDIKDTISSTVHEFGHALYDLQCAKALAQTPIYGGSSLIIHESQSRFWEKIVGQRAVFISKILAIIKQDNPEFSDLELSEFYTYCNQVKPSLIRTEADEVTYHFHVMIRFEIEKALIEGKIRVKDLPKVWAEKYQEYLGVSPKTDKAGVLQDIHWAHGSIGYFPTYSLGTALSACWLELAEKDLGSLSSLLVEEQGIEKLQSWLKDNIHKYGSTYTLNQLLAKHKIKLSPKPLLKYLNEKYRRIYK